MSIHLSTYMDGQMNVCLNKHSFIFLHECPFIHMSHQVSLCASVTMSACKKIIENQLFPNISEIVPNISQLYSRQKTIVLCTYVIISNQAACESTFWCTDGVLTVNIFIK